MTGVCFFCFGRRVRLGLVGLGRNRYRYQELSWKAGPKSGSWDCFSGGLIRNFLFP